MCTLFVHRLFWKIYQKLVSPGQSFVLHDVVSAVDPEQSLPPWYGPFFDLERLIAPDPHDLEQDPQDPQLFQMQSTDSRR